MSDEMNWRCDTRGLTRQFQWVLWGKSVACTRACRIEHVVTAMLATRHARSRRIVDEVIERFERLGGRPLPGSADQNYATQTLLKFAGQA